MNLGVRHARAGDEGSLHRIAAETFYDACPPGMDRSIADAHVAEHLSEDVFREWVKKDTHHLLLLTENGRDVGYALLVTDRPMTGVSVDGAALDPDDSTWFLSKFYVGAQMRGSGAAQELMGATVETARRHGATGVWLTVNQLNARANAFYQRNGFHTIGTATFPMGDMLHDDFVRLLRL